MFAIAAEPGGTPRSEDVFGIFEGRMRPVERLPSRFGVFRMKARAVATALPLKARDARAITVRHAIIEGRGSFRASAIAGRHGLGCRGRRPR